MLANLLSPQMLYAAKAEKLIRLAARYATRPAPELRGAGLAIQFFKGEFIISGPAETGKTFSCLYLIDRLARQYPHSQWAILRKVHRDLHGTVLQTYREHFLRDGVTVYGGEKAEWYDYPNGSRIWIGGMDRPGSALSGSRDGIFVNQAEELFLPDWEVLTTRTTGRAGHVPFGGMTFGDCNPGAAQHWIKQRAGLRLFESRHEDNPALFAAGGQMTERGQRTLATLDRLSGVRKERLRFGRWVSAEGTVYEFDLALHLIDPFPIPPEWRRFRSVDFGYTNPFVCQWWAVDGDGRMYLYRELYRTGRTVKAHSADIKRLSAGEVITETVTDHDAEDRATLEENGVSTTRARKEISVGIQRVQERLVKAGDGRPRLFVLRGALGERDESLAEARKPVSTEQEFDVYVWPKGGGGKAIKEIPVDDNNHGMDALRYAVMHAEYPAQPLPVSQPGQRSKFLDDPDAGEGSRWKRY